jgi:uncharacterized membrane protein
LYILLIILVLYSVVFSGIAIWRYEHFLCDASGDQLLFEQVIYNTAHAKLFYNNFSQKIHFGDHNSPILGLLAPFTLIFPAPYVLTVFSVLAVAVGAIPVYLLSRDLLNSRNLALLLAGSFIMLPAFVGEFYVAFHEMNLVIPFLTFAFYFFVQERFRAFIATCFLGLLVKEDVALTLFMFAPYAAIKKRSPRWWLAPAVLSVSWFLISIKVIIPYFDKRDSYGVALTYFSNIGSSLSELIINTIKAPLKTIGIMLAPDKLHYLFILLLPFGVLLPLLSAELLFAIPSLFFNLLADNSRFRFFMITMGADTIFIPRHMSLMATVFLFISAIHSIKKAGTLFPRISGKLVPGLVLVILGLTLYSDRFVLSGENYLEGARVNVSLPSAEATKRILGFIPAGATVKANINIANHLYDRKEAYYPVTNPLEPDYIVVTGQDAEHFDFTYLALIAYKYDRIAAEKSITLYRRKQPGP